MPPRTVTPPTAPDTNNFDVAVAAKYAASGHPDALGSLYDYFSDKVHRYFLTRVHDAWLADDLAGDTWAKVARSIGTFDGANATGAGFTGWLFSIAHSVLVDRGRKASRQPELLRGDWLGLDSADTADTPEQHVSRRAAARALADAVNQLGEAHRRVLTHRFFSGLSVAETAAVLGKTPEAVRKAQHDALKKLRQMLGGLDLSHLRP
jgi:RNA polymerase sigma-70 factor (ECF subfamily)